MDRRKSNKSAAKTYLLNKISEFLNNSILKNTIIIIVVVSLFSLLGLFKVGPVLVSNENYISVTGTAISVENNQAARISLTVKYSDIVKEKAIEQNSAETKNLIALIKNYGISDADLETISNALYQEDRQNTLVGLRAPQSQKVWVASTTIEATLKDLTKVDGFVSMISAQPNVEIYGPSYYLDEEKIDEARLLSDAIEEAREKAKFVTKNNNSKLGKIISIEELQGSDFSPYANVLGMGSGDSAESFQPGTTKVLKKVLVTFELN